MRFVTNAFALDSSVAVPALMSAHEHHGVAAAAVRKHRPALAGHAAFETYSSLTRLPIEHRLDPADVASAIRQTFPDLCALDSADALLVLEQIGAARVAGGAVYDALVGAAAQRNGRILLTRDRRAVNTYRAMGVNFELL